MRIFLTCCLVTIWLGSYFPTAAQQGSSPAKPLLLVSNVTPRQAEAVLKAQTNIVILDVRTPREFSGGHLSGATNIDFNAGDFLKRLAALDKDKIYLVHCAVGGRSAKARDMMEGLKFKTIYHLDGGYKAWAAEGRPVENKK